VFSINKDSAILASGAWLIQMPKWNAFEETYNEELKPTVSF
jgi:hypothetical protein